MSKRSISELSEPVFTTTTTSPTTTTLPTPPQAPFPTLQLNAIAGSSASSTALTSPPLSFNYNSSDTFKKLKNELNLLFPGNNAVIHPNVIQFNELGLLDTKTCTAFVDTLRLHGFHRVIKMPNEFAAACTNLYLYLEVLRSQLSNTKVL